MAKFLSLCIMLLAASISVSAQTYTVLHNFGSEPGDPGSPRLPGTIAQESWRRYADHSRRGRAFRIRTSGSLLVLHQV